jgi:predicted FMN-binding regulatory protein PaiB
MPILSIKTLFKNLTGYAYEKTKRLKRQTCQVIEIRRWFLNYLPEEYVSSMMKAIVAFEIEITSIEHIFKLSRNRDEESYENIVTQLQQGDEDARTIAATMKEREDKVFRNQR